MPPRFLHYDPDDDSIGVFQGEDGYVFSIPLADAPDLRELAEAASRTLTMGSGTPRARVRPPPPVTPPPVERGPDPAARALLRRDFDRDVIGHGDEHDPAYVAEAQMAHLPGLIEQRRAQE